MAKRSSRFLKLLDNYLGRFLIFLFSPCRRFRSRGEPELNRKNLKIAVLCIAAIGDLILLSEVLKSLKKKYPDIQIKLFCGPDNYAVVELVDPKKLVLSDVCCLYPKKIFRNLNILGSEKFDVVVDAGQWARISALFSWFIPTDWRIGFETPGQGRASLFDEKVKHKNTVHELSNYYALFSRWLSLKDLRVPQISVEPKKFSKKTVIFHAFSAGERSFQKEWTADKWEQLALLLKPMDYEIILTGSSSDQTKVKQMFSDKTLELSSNQIGRLSLLETAQYLAGADYVVSVNTGIMHLASAVGAKVIALHGPTNPLRWGPVSKTSTIIRSALPCSPCLNLGFDFACPKDTCMQSIDPKQVEEFILRS